MLDYCKKKGIPHKICGKLIVATASNQIQTLEHLLAKGNFYCYIESVYTSDNVKMFYQYTNFVVKIMLSYFIRYSINMWFFEATSFYE